MEHTVPATMSQENHCLRNSQRRRAAVAVSVPYVLIAISFPIFKKKMEIEKPVTIFKSYKGSLFWTVIVVFSVGLADIITVVMPAMSGDVFTSVVMVAGPIVFSIIAILLYRRYQKYLSLKVSQTDSRRFLLTDMSDFKIRR